MSKDSFYFSHDYNARSDPKIKTMLAKLGMAAYGIYWAIIEDLYNNANALPLQYDVISYDLRVDEKIVKSIICDFELFVFKGGIFSSLSVERRLEERAAKSNMAKESANARWAKVNANALLTQSECNAIKESKGKEIKVNNIKEREVKFIEDVYSFTQYPKSLLDKFISYWTELNKSQTKMKFEMQDTWETPKRLVTWSSRDNTFTKAIQPQIVEPQRKPLMI